MSDAGSDAPVTEVLRARRIEIVDDDGAVRVVVGVVEEVESGSSFGLTVLGPDGGPRVWLALPPGGPELAFSLGGNVVVHIGVSDPGPEAVEPGAYVQLAAADGAAAIGWKVAEDGAVTLGPARTDQGARDEPTPG